METLAKIIGLVVLVLIVAVLASLPLTWCWNYVMPYLFNLKTITWQHAFCLMVIGSTLFKSTTTTK